MEDKNGDPTYRKIPSIAVQEDITITHNYYNHRDADQDINLVLPLDILRDVQQDGLVGSRQRFFIVLWDILINITSKH